MIKSLSALVIFALLGASVVALPGFAPTVQARESAAMAKGDRLEIKKAGVECATQVWPNFAASCLRATSSGVNVPEARLVTARR
jgi:hypothetical protein